MRTTVTLEPELARRVKELAHRRSASFKKTLNDIIRRGLAVPRASGTSPRFVVKPHRGGFRPGIDPQRLNDLVDELEVEDFRTESRRRA